MLANRKACTMTLLLLANFYTIFFHFFVEFIDATSKQQYQDSLLYFTVSSLTSCSRKLCLCIWVFVEFIETTPAFVDVQNVIPHCQCLSSRSKSLKKCGPSDQSSALQLYSCCKAISLAAFASHHFDLHYVNDAWKKVSRQFS